MPVDLVDSHAHLDLEAFAPDLPDVLARCREQGVGAVVNVVSPFEEPRISLVRAAATTAGIRLSVATGVHPHDASRYDAATERSLEEAMGEAVAWGEIGLDYHYMHSPRDVQRRVFVRQIELARKHGKPIVVHTREADDETLAILQDAGAHETGGVIHCFTGGPELAAGAVAMGWSVSFSGILSFKNAVGLREIARSLPSDRLLVETDAPYLAPTPFRGRRNEPSFVRRVAEVLATERGESLEEVARYTSDNTKRTFRTV